MENEATVSKNFIEQIIEKDLAEGHCKTVKTRFPPEPNGYLHIGHAKSILLNYGLAKKYDGQFNLRFDDTNPTKERLEFVESIEADVKWLGADWADRKFFASNYFDKMYECAVGLIKKGKAYVSDLTPDEIREYRGTLTEAGKEDPYSKRSVEENLDLFERMKNGEFEDGADWADRKFFASNYFDKMYECAVGLIKKGKAYVSDLTPDEIREYRGTLTEAGKEDPYSKRSVEENLDLFERMKNGEFEDGTKVLRARIDMSSSNINMRDPILYRVAHMTHHNTGDKWCVYPMYDFAHPIEDAIEGITHSICTLEFEDHRPLYDWVVIECGFKNSPEESPKQIEFAKLYLTNVVTGKRYIKRLVEDGIVDGWDDPRLVSIAALRRRGFTPESIQNFVDLCGISKANSSVDYAMLEYCIREDLKAKRPRMMAVLDPVKVIIDNYPEGQVEYLEVDNNVENPELGKRKVPFTRELYVEREDFMEEPPKKYFRMFPGNEVRFMNAYFVKCNSCVKDENGNVTEIHCTYDPASKGGNSPDGRKVKGTIHWVSAEYGKQVTVRLYENIVNEELGVYNEDGSLNLNPNSLTVLDNCVVEPELMSAKAYDSFQFVRNGFFCADCKDSKDGQPVFNRIVSLKSSFKLPTAK